jgi:hypothetical protein
MHVSKGQACVHKAHQEMFTGTSVMFVKITNCALIEIKKQAHFFIT